MTTTSIAPTVRSLLKNHEETIIDRILELAIRYDYARYTSTLREAWRISVEGLTEAIAALAERDERSWLGADEVYTSDPACEFGVAAARRHRERGVNLAMFLGLTKLYRRVYRGVVLEEGDASMAEIVDQAYDRIEIAFCSEWAGCDHDAKMSQMADRNRELANEKNQLLTVLDSQAPALLLLGPEGKILQLNLAAQKLLELGEESGAYYYRENEAHPAPNWLAEHADRFMDGTADEETVEISFTAEGSRHCHELAMRRLHDVSQKWQGVVVTIAPATQSRQDVDALQVVNDEQQKLLDELQATQSQLLQSEKMAVVGQLAAGVAHEINNPLGYVSANVNQLMEYQKVVTDHLANVEAKLLEHGDEAVEAWLEETRDGIDLDYIKEDCPELLSDTVEGLTRVIKIVADLKGFSRKDDGRAEPSDLHDIIDSTVKVVWNELKYHVTLNQELGDVPPVVCFPSQISQVVMNLLLNAGHAIDDQGTVTIRTGVEAGNVWVEVEDTGKGMSDEVVARVFDPFYTTKPAGKGTGLGLSLSQEIMQKHGGELSVTTEEGVGTTFRLEWPVDGPPTADV